jgi:putative ABC transport system ATP-binding protein
MIKTNELVKVFRTDEVETTALNRVNLEISHGEFVAIMGPSGCGKSTLLNMSDCLITPHQVSSGSMKLKYQNFLNVSAQICESQT